MSSADLSSSRRSYVDWARGLAVLIMIQAHAFDAWTAPASRSTPAYRYLTILGGFAAPLFLWLAGVALVLAAERRQQKGSSRRAAAEGIVRRGLEIYILAFLFRLQAFMVSPGSWAVTIFRVDILNVMGPAIALAGLAWGVAGTTFRAVLLTSGVATLTTMVTPLVRAAGWVDRLPVWIQWHLRPFSDHTTFTLFPWMGFVFAGAACGIVLAKATDSGLQRERRIVAALGATGGALVCGGLYASILPTIYRNSSFWTSSPTYFVIRVGIMLVTLVLLWGLTRVAAWWPAPFELLGTFGRNSLFIYWIHVELAYGYVSWGIRRSLPIWGSTVGYVLFCALLYSSIQWRDRVVELWRSSRARKVTSGPIPA